MLFNDDVLFIHVPKTGGMSVTHYLLNNLDGPIRLCLPRNAFEHVLETIEHDDIGDRLTLIEGRRHEDLSEARAVVEAQGLSLEGFKLILAVIRNPYDLEVSHFHHLQKESVQEQRGPMSPAVRLAKAGDFEAFCDAAPFFGYLPARISRFYGSDGAIPANLRLIRFEQMAEDLERHLEPYSIGRTELAHRNRGKKRPTYLSYLTPHSEEAIYKKYRFLFRFYERLGQTETASAALT